MVHALAGSLLEREQGALGLQPGKGETIPEMEKREGKMAGYVVRGAYHIVLPKSVLISLSPHL